jgi:polyferredoxin
VNEPSLIVLWAVALGMAAVTAYLLRWAAEARTRVSAAVVLFLLGMMTAMLLGAGAYLLHPSREGVVVALWLTTALMSLSVFPVFYVLLRHLPSPDGTRASPATGWSAGAGYVGGVLALVLLNELLMGAVFTAAAGGGFPALASGWTGAIAQTVNGPWFLFTMATEMALSALLLRARLPGPVVILFLAQAALMALSPPGFGVLGSGTVVLASGAAGMTVIIVYLMEYLYRHRQLPVLLSRYLLALLGVYALMMAGLYLWLVNGWGVLFAASVLLEMGLFFDALLRPERLSSPLGEPWQLRPHWTFGVLASIFVAELFMGAILDLALEPSVYAPVLPSLALAGSPLTLLGNALSNGFWFVAVVTGSTWFLAMMGLEMGTLFYLKFRETRNRENRVRMILTMTSYGVFATFFPSYYYAAMFPHLAAGTAVPVLGWSMGIGSAPIAPAFFLVLALSYAITGALAFLFGRRVICSTFCTPALMYQGTTMNAMSAFNGKSPVSRKYLGSHFSRAYTVTNGTVMAALVGASFVSYYDQIGKLNLTVGGVDPTVFLFSLSFGVLWFVMFVTIPYTGNYNCVTMGWCYTGTIAQAFHKLGPYKLKVKDRKVCQSCTTLDCAKACPVSLVDMPGHFRTKGEFRSSKCCGVGNCVGACPYGNLYIHDIRHWVSERWARSRRRASGEPLPMVGTGQALAARGPSPGTVSRAAPSAAVGPVAAAPRAAGELGA